MTRSDLKLVSDLLYYELARRGIKCKQNPTLYTYNYVKGKDMQIKIETLGQLQRHFGVGIFQIFVEHPVVSNIEKNPFKIKSLSITIQFEGNGVWGKPEIQTEYEEIPPGYNKKNYGRKANKRSRVIIARMKDVMSMIYLFYQSMITIK